jgi:integrase
MGYGQPSGKKGEWRARFLKPDGTYGSKSGFKSEKEAEKAANKIEAEIEAGIWVDPQLSKTRIVDWYAEWRPAQDYASIDTAATYDQAWRKHIAPRWGRKQLGEIRPIQIQAWETELAQTYAPSTVNVILTPLRQLLEAAYANQMIGFLPVPPPNRSGARKKRARGAAASPGAVVPIETWHAICARMNPRDAMLARMVFWTGMRWSEVSAMRRRFLTLSPATDRHPASGSYYLHPDVGALHEDTAGNAAYGAPKSGIGRTWDLPPFLVEELLDYLEWLEEPGRLATFGRRRRGGEAVPAEYADLLFPNADGWPMAAAGWGKTVWRPACDGRKATWTKEAWEPIWPGLRLHDGKHTHAALLDDLGTHEVMRCDRLGHTIPGARGVYSQPTREMRARLVVALQEYYEAHLLGIAAESANFSPNEALTFAEAESA